MRRISITSCFNAVYSNRGMPTGILASWLLEYFTSRNSLSACIGTGDSSR